MTIAFESHSSPDASPDDELDLLIDPAVQDPTDVNIEREADEAMRRAIARRTIGHLETRVEDWLNAHESYPHDESEPERVACTELNIDFDAYEKEVKKSYDDWQVIRNAVESLRALTKAVNAKRDTYDEGE